MDFHEKTIKMNAQSHDEIEPIQNHLQKKNQGASPPTSQMQHPENLSRTPLKTRGGGQLGWKVR